MDTGRFRLQWTVITRLSEIHPQLEFGQASPLIFSELDRIGDKPWVGWVVQHEAVQSLNRDTVVLVSQLPHPVTFVTVIGRTEEAPVTTAFLNKEDVQVVIETN
ncbi:hypothetical protein D3C71_1775920 [compost metagenome]